MPNKPKVYPPHPMEGLKIPEESQLRVDEIIKELGDGFEVWKPEDHQTNKELQQYVDCTALETCAILIVDLYMRALHRNDKPVWGYGTGQEIGIAKGINRERSKQGKKLITIYQIIRQKNEDNYHPFDVEGLSKDFYVTKNFNSLKDCCKYVRKHHG